jgi:hypothetical protein
MSNKPLKLYVYETQPEKTYIHSFEADDFNDFMLVKLGKMTAEEHLNTVDTLRTELDKIYPDKQLIIISDGLDISFYGIRISEEEEDVSRPSDSEL